MPAKASVCVYCFEKPPPGKAASLHHPYICDLCMEAIRARQDLKGRRLFEPPAPAPGGAKKKRQRKHTTRKVATSVAVLLSLLAGCTYHRQAAIDLGPVHHESDTTLEVQPFSFVAPQPTAPPKDPS